MLSGFGEGLDYAGQVLNLLWTMSQLCNSIGLPEKFEPIIWFSFMILSYSVNILLKRYFSPVYIIFPIFCGMLLIIFVLGNASSMNFERFVENQETKETYTAIHFFRCLPYTTVFYIGLEAMPLWCKDVDKVSS